MSLEEFKNFLIEQGSSMATVESYIRDLIHFGKWFITKHDTECQPVEITSADLRNYKQELLDNNAKPATINRRFSALRKYLLWASNTGIIESIPIMPKVVNQAKRAPKWLDKKTQRKLLGMVEIQGIKRDIAIIVTLLNTGLRVSELVALKINDIELKENYGKIIVRQGKGQKYRELPLNKQTRKVLKSYMEEIEPVKNVFLGQRGTLTARGVQKLLTKYATLAKLEGVSPHTLRHTFLKNLINSGIDLGTVAALAGHTNVNTTTIYTTPSLRDLELAVNKLCD